MSNAARRSWFGPLLLIGGGTAIGTAAIFAYRKSAKTVEDVQKAIAGATPPPQLESPPSVATEDSPQFQPPMEAGTGGYVKVRTTGYWPFTAKESERKMEGGVFGAARWREKTDPRVINPAKDPSTGKRVKLVTVEMHRQDPVTFPYVSLSGDWDVWPWGQKVIIPWVDGKPIVGRVVDSGSHFHGIGKVFRAVGYEPLDVCVFSSSTKVPKKVTAQIAPGDNWERGIAVSAGNLKGQTITGDVIEACTTDDHEALARAIESELGGRTHAEQLAAAWAMRNRADQNGVSLKQLLAPNGYGKGGYASTRKVATENSKKIADEVLGSSDDPTGGATEFWAPEQQTRLNQLGDVYRAAVRSGDESKMKKYARYANYGTEGDVRLQHAMDGLQVRRIVGIIELLGRIS